MCDGAESRNRTDDTRFFRPVLYQLSYLGEIRLRIDLLGCAVLNRTLISLELAAVVTQWSRTTKRVEARNSFPPYGTPPRAACIAFAGVSSADGIWWPYTSIDVSVSWLSVAASVDRYTRFKCQARVGMSQRVGMHFRIQLSTFNDRSKQCRLALTYAGRSVVHAAHAPNLSLSAVAPSIRPRARAEL